MKKFALFLLLTTPAIAQTEQHPYAEIFPSDYKAVTCASTDPCESFVDVSFVSAAESFLLRELDAKWDEAHADELRAVAQTYCPKRATCNASPGRVWWFCNDVFAQELRAACDKQFDPKTRKNDNTQCHTWMDVYSAGVDQRGSSDWKTAQACAAKAASTGLHQMDWWMTPPVIPAHYNGPIRIFAVHRDTHIPVQADIRFEDQIIYATDPPSGQPITFYPFKWPRKLVRVDRADGHSDVVPVRMTISAPGYESITLRVPTEMPSMNVALKQAKNSITVTATDAVTGTPVEAQVYLGTQTIGLTNKPITMKMAKKHAELWVRSRYDLYSDVVVSSGAPSR